MEAPRAGFLIAGSGSIGRRHLGNLRHLGESGVTLYRTGRRDPAAPPVHAPAEFDLQAALARRPLAVLVCNPSAHHLELALAAARAGAHLLIEKPLAHRLEGTEELVHEVRARRLVALVGFQYRFHPALREVKCWLEERAIGEVVSGNVRWGEHLPSWHPGENWRASYAARADLGGGAIRTLCHPFDYLGWLLGEADWVTAEVANRVLGLDVEDTAQVLVRFASGALVTVSLDYAQRPRDHRLELVGTRGRIAWSDADGAAHLLPEDSARVTTFRPPPEFSRNTMFVEELRHFLECLAGRARPLCSLSDGMAALEIVVAALESARSGRRLRARRRP
ncbi:MAG TPA: Gfo/Idh/MocA family oxidoreductase [Vicinamibacteria bacterium]|nr:Gfo/Idh/MocA family oxidoreductase [Vicinamibacteria bacterium]